MGKIYTGQVGVELRVKTSQDLTSATNLKVRLKKPGGTEIEISATSLVDAAHPAAEGWLKAFTTLATQLDEAGVYRLYGAITLSSNEFTGETDLFRVHSKYDTEDEVP